MPAEHQDFTEFFRRKEREAAPDLAAQDAHWEGLKANLPAVRPSSGRLMRLVVGAAAAAVVLLVVLLTVQPARKNVQAAASYASKPAPAAERASAAARPAAGDRPAPVPSVAHTQRTVVPGPGSRRRAVKTGQPSRDPAHRSSVPPLLVSRPDTAAAPDSRKVFESFFTVLQKPPQVFTIDAERDTTIVCAEGSSLFIPARSFAYRSGETVSGPAVIEVQEFYALSDMIGSKLSTTSDSQILETGGMLHINVMAKSETLAVRPGAQLELKMPAPQFDPRMQLFTGRTAKEGSNNGRNGEQEGRFDWLPAGQRQTFFADRSKLVPVLNLQNNPERVFTKQPVISFGEPKSRTVAVFEIPYNSPLSVAEIKSRLTTRYGRYYDEIRVRREWKPLWRKNRRPLRPVTSEWWGATVGDSIYLTIKQAVQFKYITREDSLRLEAKWQADLDEAIRRDAEYKQFLQVSEQYRFRLDGLGWINCDRFYRYPAARLAEFVARPAMAFDDSYVYSILIFKKGNVAIACDWRNGQIRAPRLPIGEVVSLVCLGVKNGKAYTCIQELTTSKEPIGGLKFVESTPEQFREQLRRFGSVGNRG